MNDSVSLGRSKVSSSKINAKVTQEHRTELDIHADQSCVGDNATVLNEWPDFTVEVGPFLDTLGCMKLAPVVTAAVAYDDPSTGKSILLAILIQRLGHNIPCPMQMRNSGVTVNDRPKRCTPIPIREDHAIIIPDGNYMIPLSISGVTSYFPSRNLTREEVERYQVNGDYLELTAESPVWDPHSTIFQDLEMRLVDRYGEVEDNRGIHPRQLFTLSTETSLDDPFMKLRVAPTTTTKRPGNWNAEFLARNWGIGRDSAERTLRATTRLGVRKYDGNEVGVERRFSTGDRHQRYNRLNHSVYRDTLFSSIKSSRGNKCSQVYATDFC
jgi:hypothetical protein